MGLVIEPPWYTGKPGALGSILVQYESVISAPRRQTQEGMKLRVNSGKIVSSKPAWNVIPCLKIFFLFQTKEVGRKREDRFKQ